MILINCSADYKNIILILLHWKLEGGLSHFSGLLDNAEWMLFNPWFFGDMKNAGLWNAGYMEELFK